MKTTHVTSGKIRSQLLVVIFALTVGSVRAADPHLDSWFTANSGKYARVYTNDANKTAGASLTTWGNGSQNQTLPAYAGVQEIYSSPTWVYIRSTGLGSHIMEPWLNGAFPNLPKNQKVFYRIPRTPATNGTHHYHANPIALRYLLGDHVDYNATTKTYSESTNALIKHSPILGWVRDGYPVYGPYGYSVSNNASSGVRRMLSGFQLRNGSRNTDNLTTAGRATIPQWAVRAYNVGIAQSGPAVSTTYPLGRYMEDNAFLGDLGYPSRISPFQLQPPPERWHLAGAHERAGLPEPAGGAHRLPGRGNSRRHLRSRALPGGCDAGFEPRRPGAVWPRPSAQSQSERTALELAGRLRLPRAGRPLARRGGHLEWIFLPPRHRPDAHDGRTSAGARSDG